ncbi:MAG: aminotransferase class V-fold PLP-dependent enzyme, partial [Coriobacteriia bacterium]|nr:aminotransferase class V-fold PLP-dependent enzyme [Coriobacteriia bacterium]
HASNVSGAVAPVAEIAAAVAPVPVLVDAAQSAGSLPLDFASLGVAALACSGHKGLLGPQGVGLLYLAPGFEPDELVQGGSGGDSEDIRQPGALPDRYEAGTGNTPGIAGLGAAAEYLLEHGDEIRARERALTLRLVGGLLEMPWLRVLGPPPEEPRVPLVSVVHERMTPDEMAHTLDHRWGIALRAGLHCTPWTHEAIGTLGSGALRFSLGDGLSEEDVDAALEAMRALR